MKLKKLFLLFATAAMLMCGCAEKVTGEDALNTDLTDKLRLDAEYEGKSFVEPEGKRAIGKVLFRSHTDGDTTNFNAWKSNNTYEYIKVRYLGVNTPESTAQIDPWGLRASKYTKEIVSKAKLIVLENYFDFHEQFDTNGTRYLGFVWYSMDGESPLRLLNLELVEMAYSRNNIQDQKHPYYKDFAAAEKKAEKTGAHIYGQIDEEFDYSNDVVTCSINHLLTHYNDYGVVTESLDDVPASSGKQLRVTGVVIGLIGDSFIVRDLQKDVDQKDDDKIASIYTYAGYNTSLRRSINIGDVVRFYCKLTKFNDTMQLSDLKASTVDPDVPFQILKKGLTGPTDERPTIDNTIDLSHVDLSLFEMDEQFINTIGTKNKQDSSVSSYAELEEYAYKIVKTRITIRNVEYDDTDEDGNKLGDGFSGFIKTSDGNSKAYTVYGSLKKTGKFPYCNIRVDNAQNPYIYPYDEDGKLANGFWKLGHTYECVGYLAPYFDKYQLQLLNNTNNVYGTYVTDVTE